MNILSFEKSSDFIGMTDFLQFSLFVILQLDKVPLIHAEKKVVGWLNCELTFPKYVKPCSSATPFATSSPPGIWRAQVGVKCLSLRMSSSLMIWCAWNWLGRSISFDNCVSSSRSDTELAANKSSFGGRIRSSPFGFLTSIVKLLVARIGSLNTKLTFWFITSQMNNRAVMFKCAWIVAAIDELRCVFWLSSFCNVLLLLRFDICNFPGDVMTSRCCEGLCCEDNRNHRTTSLVIFCNTNDFHLSISILCCEWKITTDFSWFPLDRLSNLSAEISTKCCAWKCFALIIGFKMFFTILCSLHYFWLKVSGFIYDIR